MVGEDCQCRENLVKTLDVAQGLHHFLPLCVLFTAWPLFAISFVIAAYSSKASSSHSVD